LRSRAVAQSRSCAVAQSRNRAIARSRIARSRIARSRSAEALGNEPAPGTRRSKPAEAEQTRYLEEHLAACGRAVRRGVPLTGHFAESLLDKFEWAAGYDAPP